MNIWKRWSYKPVAQDKFEVEADSDNGRESPPSKRIFLIISGVLVLDLVVFEIFLAKDSWSPSCQNPRTRQEWRSLNASQQGEFIDAVRCLMRKPSQLEPGTYRYDDFVYIHTKEGTSAHYAAAFLAWHRYFIHLYEKVLRAECGFQGSFPYWDWTLDSHDLSASPIWEAFGGDGDPSGPVVLHNGRCVLDGPFANATRHWQSEKIDASFQTTANPHCLSRGFASGGAQKAFQNSVSPSWMKELLRQKAYSNFFELLEASAHNAIPQFINGDFFALSAPNDPVFFLHHAQVDRLWWMWQKASPDVRYDSFDGPKEDFRQKGGERSSLEDPLYAGILGDDVRVKDIIRVDHGLLCYRY